MAKDSGQKVIDPDYNDGFLNTSPVGHFAANPLGLYDMGGNVLQLCLDSEIQQNELYYYVRGGSWFYDGAQDALRSTAEFRVTDFTPCPHIGFRCVLVLGAAEVLEEGLTAWWKADGDARDWMGTHSGEMKDGAVFAPGRDGLAFSFAGTAPQVAVPPDAAWAFGDQEFTIALWAKFPTADVRQALLSCSDGTESSDRWIVTIWDGALLWLSGRDTWLGGAARIPAAPAPTWHHLGVSRSGSTFRFYVDGEELAVQEAATAPAPQAGRLTIGGAEGWAHFQGLLDDVRIYHRALSTTEIKSLAEAFGPLKH